MSSKLYEKLKAYKNYANDCIQFKIIFSENDLKEKQMTDSQENLDLKEFKPEFTHQIFGDDEEIFGYKNLKIDYYLTPGLLDAYIGLSCKEKISSQRFEGIEPDDVYSAFMKFGCSPHFTRNLDTFLSEKIKFDKEFRPFGEKIYQYNREINGKSDKYEIFKMDSSLNEYTNQKFIDYLLNVQTMLIYYIETASFVDTDDPQWTYYLLYQNKKIDTDNRYITIGYLSVYNYYAYPDKTRSRVSQILILPNYQKFGHGAELLQAVYKDACENSKIIDVTAESPSQEFITLRDYVTTKMLCNLKLFRDKNKLKRGFTNEMAQEAMKNFKIPKFQSRRVYEILRMFLTNENNSNEWRDFRLDIKKRLYLPFIRKNKYVKNSVSATNGKNITETIKQNKLENFEKRLNGEKLFNICNQVKALNSKLDSINQNYFVEKKNPINSFCQKAFEKLTQKKNVSFKSTSLNNSTANSSEMNEDENISENEAMHNIFVCEEDRKKYLEERFQECVIDYRKILKRLENEGILPF